MLQAPLHIACVNGHNAIIEVLLANGANMLEPGWIDGSSALHLSVQGGQLMTCKLLVEGHGFPIDQRNGNMGTPLLSAVSRKQTQVSKETRVRLQTVSQFRLSKGLHIWSRSIIQSAQAPAFTLKINTVNCLPYLKYTISYIIEYHMHTYLKQIAMYLISKGADVNLPDWEFDTPLTVASKNGVGDFAIVEELLKAGGKIGHKDQYGYDSLASAASNGHVETLKELLRCGGDKMSLTSSGRSLVHVAAGTGKVGTGSMGLNF